jgi:hypothetical protein
VTCAEESPWAILPRDKRVGLGELAALRAPHAVLTDGFAAALLRDNPWLRALRRLGHEPAVDARMVPVEEGETSLNANGHQALAALLALAAGAEQGVSPTVIGSLAGGNHGLDQVIVRLAASFPEPPRARAALTAALGPAALAAAEPLLAASRTQVRKAFRALPDRLRQARALRLPACRVPAPPRDVLEILGAGLGLDRPLCDRLIAAREAIAEAGLTSFADLWIVLRADLVHDLAARLGLRRPGFVPTSLEHLVARGTPAGFADRSLASLAAHYHAVLAASSAGRTPDAPVYGGRYRLLNHFDPLAVLLRGARRDGRGELRPGWASLHARFASGALAASPDDRALAELPVGELLARGYGLSGKLTYMAVREVNGGGVCNQVRWTSPDVFAGLADPACANRVLALGWVNVNGAWQSGAIERAPALDLLVLWQWLDRCPDPAATLARLLGAFRQQCDPEVDRPAPRSWLVLDARPGSFRII